MIFLNSQRENHENKQFFYLMEITKFYHQIRKTAEYHYQQAKLIRRISEVRFQFLIHFISHVYKMTLTVKPNWLFLRFYLIQVNYILNWKIISLRGIRYEIIASGCVLVGIWVVMVTNQMHQNKVEMMQDGKWFQIEN